MLNREVFSRQIAMLVFRLCGSQQQSRSPVLAFYGYPHTTRKVWVDWLIEGKDVAG